MRKFVPIDYQLQENEVGIEHQGMFDHHGENDSKFSATEQALLWPPKATDIFVANHVDYDTSFAIALLELKQERALFDTKLALAIGIYDRLGTSALEGVEEIFILLKGAHISYPTQDQEKLDVMVALAKALLTGAPIVKRDQYISAAETYQIAAKEALKVVEYLAPKVVFIETTFFGALGYAYEELGAEVVVAHNPEFHSRSGMVIRKYTIAKRHQSGNFNLAKLLQKISTLEEGWGGHPNSIIGSPFNGTMLEVETVKKLVREEALL